jgi:cell wall-associated NlpC family hydrolase
MSRRGHQAPAVLSWPVTVTGQGPMPSRHALPRVPHGAVAFVGYMATASLLAGSLLGLHTAPLQAQGPFVVGAYAARNDALPSTPHLGGLAFTSFAGPFGFRLSGGLHFMERTRAEGESPSVNIGAWTADADAVFAPFRSARWLRVLTLGFSPYGFAGIGGHGIRLRDTPDTSLATWSYGVGVSRGLIGPLGFDAEMRYRQPLERERVLPTGFVRDWEYRMGLSVSFGGGKSRRPDRRYDRAHGHGHDRARGTTPRTGRVEARRPERRPATWPAEARDARTATRVVATADRYVGTRYVYGGTSPQRGFDCSGFVQYVFAQEGVSLPRTSRQMARIGEPVDRGSDDGLENLRAGDLLFFAHDGSRIDHVAIYAGRGRIIHSSASGGGVRYDDLDTERGRWFAERVVEVRRLVADGRVLVSPFARYDDAGDDELDPPDRAPRPRAGGEQQLR